MFFYNDDFLFCCRQRQFYLDYYHLLDQSYVLYAQFFNKETRKKSNPLRDLLTYILTKHFTIQKITTLNAALSSYLAFLTCPLHSELWSRV